MQNRLAAVAGVTAALLGVLMVVGGVGLGLAVVSSPQPPLQTVTAVVLTLSGLVNLRFSRQVWRADRRGLLSSGAATATLVLYLSAVLRDFGEPLLAHSLYLLLLLAVWSRAGVRGAVAI